MADPAEGRGVGGADEADRLVERITRDPVLAARLAEALSAPLLAESRPSLWKRSQPFVAALSSAAVVLLAFLLPSVQDQWDRYHSRSAVDRYEQIGRALLDAGHYASAEQAFGKALELAGTQRLDLLQGELQARVLRVNEDQSWLGEIPDDVTESDFIYLLELEADPAQVVERAATLGAYGVFLASKGRWADAEARLRESLAVAPRSADTHVNLANLLGDLDRPKEAEAEYRAALSIDPNEPAAHYDLGVFLADAGRTAEAEQEFRAYVRLEPQDPAGYERLGEQLQALGRADAAREALDKARRLDPAAARERRAGAARTGQSAPEPAASTSSSS